MKREELEHIIRASGDITNQYDFVIIGSQSILGPVPNPEPEFTASTEADIYPLDAPDLADDIEGAIGEGSQFHTRYGYYAQGVRPTTAILPADWMSRVHRVQNGNTNGLAGFCLDTIDLFLSKAAAGRDKDREFCMALFEHGYVTPSRALELVPSMPLTDGAKRSLRATIRRWAKAVRDAGHHVSEE